jgi:hypothetical protein
MIDLITKQKCRFIVAIIGVKPFNEYAIYTADGIGAANAMFNKIRLFNPRVKPYMLIYFYKESERDRWMNKIRLEYESKHLLGNWYSIDQGHIKQMVHNQINDILDT